MSNAPHLADPDHNPSFTKAIFSGEIREDLVFPFPEPSAADKEAAMVKWYASEMAERVTSDALQIFGGAGYTKLHAVERYWRDARLTKIFEGTSEIQLRIISDRLLGKPTQRANA